MSSIVAMTLKNEVNGEIEYSGGTRKNRVITLAAMRCAISLSHALKPIMSSATEIAVRAKAKPSNVHQATGKSVNNVAAPTTAISAAPPIRGIGCVCMLFNRPG